MTPADRSYSEQLLIEEPAIELFSSMEWETANCFFEKCGEESTLGRQTTSEVVLVHRLRDALRKLNPGLRDEALEQAVEELTKDRATLSPVEASREIYKLLKDGVRVSVADDEGSSRTEIAKVIDWDNPENNDFFLASQFWISGEMYKRRVDMLGFVNGIPLVLFELKAVHKRLEHGYSHNISDYKDTIPQLFRYLGFVVVSNGTESRVGSPSAPWEHFNEWKRISDEQEAGVVSLETIIRGTCDKTRCLDLLENFTLFTDIDGPLIRLIAKNHQYLGVNNAISAVTHLGENRGRLGVFWHTQGSGKSYSMIFFSQKVLRKIPGNWTFLIVTDRQELDHQIYKTFANAGAVTEQDVQATSGEQLRQLLSEDHRHVFTLIQKFRIEKGKAYPRLSERPDIIVITDEAHRTQYDILAQNMRNALPNAAFLGFTGTPLIAGEEKTRTVFGDYVSVYNFSQSVEDGATVRLFYENRIPELQLTNQDLNEDMEALLEEAELDEDQEKKLEREFAREYHLITRDDRLQKIAEDIVGHFIARGFKGKAMVISIDKATAVRMYDKVTAHWKRRLEQLKSELKKAHDGPQAEELRRTIAFMAETDMAVVVSQAQGEIEAMRKRGLDIAVHRKRMATEDLAKKFKDSKDPFRIVFVCAMWMTGFDVPSCSTIYLDKPMRNHTLMQTIARANRVFSDKLNGLIVDYVGVFRNLEKALAIYGSGSGGGIEPGETPVLAKEKLVEALRNAIAKANAFCRERGVELARIEAASGFQRVKLVGDAVEAMVVNDETKRRFLSVAGDVSRYFTAMLPDPSANEFIGIRGAVSVIADKIRSLTPDPDISNVMAEVEALLDRSVAAEGYVIHQPVKGDEERLIDLGKIDFEKLQAKFKKGRKHTEAERLRGAIERKLRRLVALNRSRVDYLQKFQQMIDEYNAGALNVELFFDQLVEFAKDLNEEEKRGISESLSEEELALFDILTKPEMKLSPKEKKQVKKVARELLARLKDEKLVLDWRKRQQSRAAVLVTIRQVLDEGLPDEFTPDVFEQKCGAVYEHVYDSYFGEGKSIYDSSAASANS